MVLGIAKGGQVSIYGGGKLQDASKSEFQDLLKATGSTGYRSSIPQRGDGTVAYGYLSTDKGIYYYSYDYVRGTLAYKDICKQFPVHNPVIELLSKVVYAGSAEI